MTQLLLSLAAFFNAYSAFGGLDGVLTSKDGIGSSHFAQRPKNAATPWSELSVLDPTQPVGENSELAPRLVPATQLLIAYELRRANSHMPAALDTGAQDHAAMRQIFEPVLENRNSLPTTLSGGIGGGIGAIMLLGDPCKGVGTLYVGIIESTHAHSDEWKANFLHRSDIRSEVYVRLCDFNKRAESFTVKKQGLVLCPCHFVCRVAFETIEKSPLKKIELGREDLDRFKSMQTYLEDLHAHHQAQMESGSAGSTETTIEVDNHESDITSEASRAT